MCLFLTCRRSVDGLIWVGLSQAWTIVVYTLCRTNVRITNPIIARGSTSTIDFPFKPARRIRFPWAFSIRHYTWCFHGLLQTWMRDCTKFTSRWLICYKIRSSSLFSGQKRSTNIKWCYPYEKGYGISLGSKGIYFKKIYCGPHVYLFLRLLKVCIPVTKTPSNVYRSLSYRRFQSGFNFVKRSPNSCFRRLRWALREKCDGEAKGDAGLLMCLDWVIWLSYLCISPVPDISPSST